MKQLARLNTKRKIIGITILILCLLGLFAYIGRGWVRQDVVPFYTQVTYLHEVQNHFDKDFKPVNLILSQIGYTFSATDNDGCNGEYYRGFGQSITCIKSTTSAKLTPSTDLTKEWKGESPKLEQLLLSSGWSKDNIQQPIGSLLDTTDPADTSQLAVSYTRHHGKVSCALSIRNSPSSREIYATESCEREIDFFGGY